MNNYIILSTMAIGLLASPAQAADDAKEPNPTMDDIKARCDHDWPGDYAMQKYCIDQQVEGLTAIWAFATLYGFTFDDTDVSNPYEQIMNKCAMAWTDKYGGQWAMISYCAVQQAAAYKAIQ